MFYSDAAHFCLSALMSLILSTLPYRGSERELQRQMTIKGVSSFQAGGQTIKEKGYELILCLLCQLQNQEMEETALPPNSVLSAFFFICFASFVKEK